MANARRAGSSVSRIGASAVAKRTLETTMMLAMLSSSGCFSPVQDEAIEALGPEQPGLEEGPLHRYGQPCLVCHGGYGPGEPDFTFAGTVFATPNDDIPVKGARVRVTDAAGSVVELVTNCAGNFFFPEKNRDLVFPLRAEVECKLEDGTVRRSVMGTRIQRDGACASCHEKGPAKPTGPAQVYCFETMPDPPLTVPQGCEGGPQ